MSKEGSVETRDRTNGGAPGSEDPGTDTVTPAEAETNSAPDPAAATAEGGNEAAAGETRTAEDEAREAAEARAEEDEDAEAAETDMAALRKRLEEVEAQARDYWERLLRTEAEKENLRKRAARDADSARTQGLEKIASEMLAVRDSLEMGVAAAREEEADVERIREGTELTLNMLVQAMDKCGIEAIDPVGEKFDPEAHQAMSMQESDQHESNTVIAVMQKGYRLNNRLLRPAMVIVAK